MRLGVSGKVLLSFAVLLVALAGNATFTVLSIHRARQGVVANEAYLDLQGSVDAAWKSLNDFAPSLGRNVRLDPNLALAFRISRKHLDDAVAAIDRYLEKEPSSFRRPDFEAKRRQIVALRVQLDVLGEELAGAEVGAQPKARGEFESHYATLTHSLNRMRRPLRGESGQIAQRLSDDEETALQMAVALGIAGLVVALGAFLFTLRTLRPLGVLRARARQVAGGEYARRTGVTSKDEIGDLAREFDAMAGAIQEREQRLIRSERLATVGRMAAQITHEVRNPLASIGLYAELLGDELGESAEARRLVASIISEVDRLTEITETYLRFARLPRPKLEPEDIGAVVTGVLEFARAELQQAGIALEVQVAPSLPEVAADEAQLRQALLNLVRNAREAMSGQGQGRGRGISPGAGGVGGRLRVTVDGEGNDVRIRVADSGPGIPPDDLGKIFEPFFSTKERGTGLGLALVQQIVAAHGGRVDVESTPGAGTAFVLSLPATPAATREAAAPPAEEHPLGEAREPIAKPA